MKKVISMALALMILFSFVNTAFTEEKEGIMFLGIPWGTSLDEVSDILMEKGLTDAPPGEGGI